MTGPNAAMKAAASGSIGLAVGEAGVPVGSRPEAERGGIIMSHALVGKGVRCKSVREARQRESFTPYRANLPTSFSSPESNAN